MVRDVCVRVRTDPHFKNLPEIVDHPGTFEHWDAGKELPGKSFVLLLL